MADYKSVATLSATDAAYIAGLIDGEGTVTLSRRHKHDMRQPVISISNTDLSFLDYVLRATKAGKITRKRTSSSKHTPSAAYAISNRQGLCLLRQIEPYLRTYKKQRAELILRDYVRLTPRNGKYTSAARAARTRFEIEVLSVKPNATAMSRATGHDLAGH